MFGWIVAAHQIGAGAIAYLAGSIRTNQGSYDQGFLALGAACILTRRPAVLDREFTC